MATDAFSIALSDRYRIDGELGRGGMATVYLADDLKHGRKVAIKVMHPELAPVIGKSRFLHEIEVAARLNHPHIVPLFDSGVATGQLFYVMPHVEGESLRKCLLREKQLSLEEAIRLAREIASALGYAHHRNLVHRDIKPENVLLADGIALVADFGMARASSLDPGDATRIMTAVGAIVGTPQYMAPEQAVGASDVDGRADLYALGCTLYEMLVGQPPFRASTVSSLIAMHRDDPVPPLQSMRPEVPEAVVRVIETALAKEPADRYPTMARFAEALTLAVRGRSVTTTASGAADAGFPNNLPRQRTRFIGREKELAQCAQLLEATRLLTLTGVGGCGKTRLALRLAEQILDCYPGGVWYVGLAAVFEEEQVPLETARALSVPETPGKSLTEALIRHLSTRRALMVLDNCEHLLGAVAALADHLLDATDGLQLIVTSREGLGIEGEHIFAVRSLSVPTRELEFDLHEVQACESAQLFVDRGQAVHRRFALDNRTAPVVAEICRRLDGIPLAIELAAARVKLLSVEEIRDRLDDRFRLLTGGVKAAIPRHKTLRATIEWSYDHLSSDEQRLLRALGVFVGGWTLVSATALWGDDADEFEVLELLGHLVDKSLVLVDRVPDGSTRYSMLETVGQYVHQRLQDAGEIDAVRSRHLKYFLTIAAEPEDDQTGRERVRWLKQLQQDWDNLLRALEQSLQLEAESEKGLRIAAPILEMADYLGHRALGYRIALQLLERTQGAPMTSARALIERWAGKLASRQGRLETARAHLDAALEYYRQAGDREGTALTLVWCSNVSEWGTPECRAMKEESIELCRESGIPHLRTSAAISLAEYERFEGNLEAARKLYEEALVIGRQSSNPLTIVLCKVCLSTVEITEGHLTRARELLQDALRVTEEGSLRFVIQFAIDVTSALAAASGDLAAAARFAGIAQRHLDAIGGVREQADEPFHRIWVDRIRAELGDDAFEAAFGKGLGVPESQGQAEVRAWLAGGSVVQGG